MSKELFVSSTPHETKVAIVEDDQLAEIYFERENEYTLAGSIYKGRVTRVLPGMQSAFVDLGLERDAFLYVTDFLEEQEDQEEFDHVALRTHERAPKEGDAAPPARAADLDPHHALPPAAVAEPGAGMGGRGERDRGDRGERQPLSNAATINEAGGDE
ncbi:MAG: ribonuclease, partial [Acidobacteriota bacterium]|nr:ribonuclease [Acidobacteriota bacterium]